VCSPPRWAADTCCSSASTTRRAGSRPTSRPCSRCAPRPARATSPSIPNAPVVALLNELDASVDLLALDREDGTLNLLHTVSTLPPGFSGEPWSSELRFTPDGKFLVTSERRSSTLATFAVDAERATLTLVGHTPTQAQPRGFAISPSGRHVVVAGQLSHQLSVHALRPGDGTLSLVAEHPVGRNPNWVEALALP
jgi:6-phosphogluconolactonase